MHYTNLGKTGMKVSRLCLGMMSYGAKSWREWVLDEEQAKPEQGAHLHLHSGLAATQPPKLNGRRITPHVSRQLLLSSNQNSALGLASSTRPGARALYSTVKSRIATKSWMWCLNLLE